MPNVTASYGRLFEFIVFLGYLFSYIIEDHSYLNCCISAKLSQIVCLINVHILVCQYVECQLQVMEGSRKCRYEKVNLCNNLWLRQYSFWVIFQ